MSVCHYSINLQYQEPETKSEYLKTSNKNIYKSRKSLYNQKSLKYFQSKPRKETKRNYKKIVGKKSLPVGCWCLNKGVRVPTMLGCSVEPWVEHRSFLELLALQDFSRINSWHWPCCAQTHCPSTRPMQTNPTTRHQLPHELLRCTAQKHIALRHSTQWTLK